MTTTDTGRMETLDRAARALHAEAVAHVPARTLQRLRTRRTSAAPARPRPAHTLGWAAAAACMAVFALAIGFRQAPLEPDAIEPSPLVAADVPAAGNDEAEPGNDAYANALASLDEDPGLYLWLASSDAQPLAME